MNSWLAKDSSQWTTRSARRSHQRWLTRVRRGVGAALVMAMAILGLTMAPFAHAADTAATIEKTIVSPKSSYAIGDTVTYRLTLQCSSLTGSCGIGTITDILDSHQKLTDANDLLPTSGTVRENPFEQVVVLIHGVGCGPRGPAGFSGRTARSTAIRSTRPRSAPSPTRRRSTSRPARAPLLTRSSSTSPRRPRTGACRSSRPRRGPTRHRVSC